MRKSKLALARLALIALLSVTVSACAPVTSQESGPEPTPAPTQTLRATTLDEALAQCETLPEYQVEDCLFAALDTAWGE